MKLLKTNTSMRFFLFVSLAVILVNIPILGNYVGVINTLIHESGHALIALIGGDVQKIGLFVNTEGVTYTSHTSWFGGFFTGIAGYVFSSLFAFICFWLIGKKRYKLLMFILLCFIFMNLVFWVRNFYGIFWLITFGAGFLFMIWKAPQTVNQSVLLLIAAVLLVESLTSSFEILLLSFIQPATAGDATGLAQATIIIPAQVWGIFFMLQSLWFCWFGLKKGIFRLDR